MEQIKIIRRNIEEVENSGITVQADNAYSTVSIEADGSEGIFLQGHEADAFIEEAKALYNNEALDLNMDEALLATAYPYIGIIAEI